MLTSTGSAGVDTRCFQLRRREWLAERMVTMQTVLERRTHRSALLRRKLLGPIRMEPVTPDIGRPYYRALSDLDVRAHRVPPGGGSSQRWHRRQERPRGRGVTSTHRRTDETIRVAPRRTSQAHDRS
jgi:hypothetical protein